MKDLSEYKNITRFIKENFVPELGGILNMPPPEFLKFMEYPPYEAFRIPKKKGGYRNIESPAPELKRVQRCFCLYLNAGYNRLKPECVHGFVSGKGKMTRTLGIFSNALPHTGKKFVLNIDIKDFFESISAAWIKAKLMSHLQLNDHMASVITQLCTYKKHLPAGAPSSPILSNIYCLQMDYDLIRFSSIHGLTFSRYADDLTFSSNEIIDDDIIGNIKSILNLHGFVINKNKLRIKTKDQRQTVTGLVVNKKVNVNRRYRKRLRAILHDIKTNGYAIAAQKHYKNNTEITQRKLDKFKNKVSGMKAFVAGINNDNLFTQIIINGNK